MKQTLLLCETPKIKLNLENTHFIIVINASAFVFYFHLVRCSSRIHCINNNKRKKRSASPDHNVIRKNLGKFRKLIYNWFYSEFCFFFVFVGIHILLFPSSVYVEIFSFSLCVCIEFFLFCITYYYRRDYISFVRVFICPIRKNCLYPKFVNCKKSFKEQVPKRLVLLLTYSSLNRQ